MQIRLPVRIFLLVSLFLSACTKSGNKPNNTSDNSTLVEFKTHFTTAINGIVNSESDTLIYDNNGRMVALDENFMIGDVTQQPITYAHNYIFGYNGNESVPYMMNAYSFLSSSQVDHYLYYDDQLRIIRDSIADGVVANFSYETGFIAIEVYEPVLIVHSNTIPAYRETDTLYLQDGNITAYRIYVYDQPEPGLGKHGDAAYTYTYSSFKNPFYESGVSNSLGPLFWLIFSKDPTKNFISKLLQTSLKESSADPGVLTWTTDNLGRVSSGELHEPLSYSGTTGTYYDFIYK